ncbi:DUF6086 family protein [Streptomyces sp. MMS24-I2-30]|uniref:DUF6086 family protein n=1 Tax=Streptomyces sp. MMS24-I2-30 TaxID=3351564 RepID=UPI003896AC50
MRDGRPDQDALGPGAEGGKTLCVPRPGAGELLELPTGLTPNERGGADVDISTFQAFTQGLYDTCCATKNVLMHDLLRGLLLASIVMLEKGGGTVVREPDREAGLLDDHEAYVRRMWVED